MKIGYTLAKAASVLAFAAMATSSHATGIFNEFTVNEGSVPGNVANTFEADKGNGAYNEVLTIKYDGSFTSAAYADFGQFLKDDGKLLVSPTQLNGLNGYGMYATFTATGVLSATGFTGLTGVFNLFIDPGQNTTKTLGATGNDAVIIGGVTGDDYLIASTKTIQYLFGIPGTPGAFDFMFKDLVLTAEGSQYFSKPDPFHVKVQVNGDFDNMATLPTLPGFPDSVSVNTPGDLSFVFPVSEPTSLALIGLGLLGLGTSRRRRTIQD